MSIETTTPLWSTASTFATETIGEAWLAVAARMRWPSSMPSRSPGSSR